MMESYEVRVTASAGSLLCHVGLSLSLYIYILLRVIISVLGIVSLAPKYKSRHLKYVHTPK